MKTITATVAYFVNVQVEVSEDELEGDQEYLYDKIIGIANEVMGGTKRCDLEPCIHECSDERFVD